MQSRKWLLFVALAAAVVYILIDNTVGRFFFDFVPKTLPIWILSYLVFVSVRNLEGRLVSVGLLFGSGGDVTLALDRFYPGSGLFLVGLGLFLVGHLFYIAAWYRRFQFRTARAIPAAVVMVIAAALSVWLTPQLGELAIPVYTYIGVIALMSTLSFLRSRNSIVVPIGSVIFVLSDAIIAVNKFHSPVPMAGLWIMLTYYAAQAFLGLGFVDEQKE